MTIADLQIKIADVLGVSASQKELSFEIFVDKISDILLEEITLKVPRIGYFQLKSALKDSANNELIFSPLSADFSPESQNLYLAIDVTAKRKNTQEFDSNIFSIGVGKPLLPLSADEPQDSETSYAMLKKSIEERVKELLMESDQIPNFNIWDDYYKSPAGSKDAPGDETESQLSDLTADLKFIEESISDKIPEKIRDDFNFSPDDSAPISPLDYTNFLNDEIPREVKPEISDNADIEPPDPNELLPPIEWTPELSFDRGEPSEEEPLTAYGQIEEVPPEEKSVPELITPSEEVPEQESAEPQAGPSGEERSDEIHFPDYVESEDVSLNPISISDLLDDPAPGKEKKSGHETKEIEESVVPVDEVIPKMLEEKYDSAGESPHDTLREEINSAFEELHNVSDEIKSTRDDEVVKRENDPVEEDDEKTENAPVEEDEERIEWNWGDELREEFGLTAAAREDANFEMIDSGKEGDLELVDDFLEEEDETHDLFSRLEKTLEREFSQSEGSKPRLTKENNRTTFERNKLKKVVMEFSGPPAKYEFVEERPAEKVRRMAITLVDGEGTNSENKFTGTGGAVKDQNKDSYFGKMFLIIFGAFVVVAAVVIFIIMNGNNANKAVNQSTPAENTETGITSDAGPAGSTVQPNTAANDASTLFNDDFSDFPRTAKPPVPIKDATDRQILETIKKETAKLKESENKIGNPAIKQAAAGNANKSVNAAATAETKIGNRIFSDGKNYYLQISSWPNRIRADEEVTRLKSLGFNAFIVEVNLPQKGGIWYRVRVGPFNSGKETEEFMNKNNL